MRARFAEDVVFTDSDKIEPEAKSLDERIDTFKHDSQNMEVLQEFVDDVLQNAKDEAIKKQQIEAAAAKNNGRVSQQAKEKLRQNFKNGKVVNRARGLVVRIFDAICNCANSAAAPAQRIKLRGKQAAAAANKGKNGDKGVIRPEQENKAAAKEAMPLGALDANEVLEE